MRKLLITASIFLIALGIAVLEYGFFPHRVQPLSLSANINDTSDSEHDDISGFDMVVSQIALKNFELAGLKNISKKNSNTVRHLFGNLVLTPEENQMAVLKSDFFSPDENGEEILLVSVYEIFPLHATTVSKAFSILQNMFEEKFANDVETGINRTDEFGIHSLYFNSSATPERAFLLAVTRERLIGFEYQKENHNQLIPLFFQLAPLLRE